jgi:beta-propeller repeat-containing protein
MTRTLRPLACGGLLILWASVGFASGPATKPMTGVPQAARPPVLRTYGNLPLSFEVNQGQADSSVRFLSRAGGSSLYLSDTEATLSLRRNSTSPRRSRGKPWDVRAREPEHSDVVRMKLVGANPAPRIEGVGELPGKSNYFIGNDPKKWRTNIANYARVEYRDVYPGVNLTYYGNQRLLEYDLTVAPGADPGVIRLAFEGIRKMRLDDHGDLVLRTKGGEIVQQKPVVYQEANGTKREISGRYVIKGRGQVGLQVARYDASKPLVIDPVLSYSTYLGEGRGFGIAVDPAGNAYVTGETDSVNFPTVNAFQPTFAGPSGPCVGCGFSDAFVTKFNALGGLSYSTYLGGGTGFYVDSGGDGGTAIALDPAGNAYIAGWTSATDFPLKNAFRTIPPGGFVTKLNPAGALAYSTYLPDFPSSIAVDSAGSAYLTGGPDGEDLFPTTPGAVGAGDHGAFVIKLNPSGMTLDYSAIIGGVQGAAIAVDTSGNAYVTGVNRSFGTDFPVRNAYQSATRKDGDISYASDAFVTKLNATGTDLVYSTYLGSSCLLGCSEDRGLAIAVDSAGSAYVAGDTYSSDFPTTPGAFQTDSTLGVHTFVTKFDGAGALVYSTYLSGVDIVGIGRYLGIAADSAGNAYVTGRTRSNLPIVNPFQTAAGGGFVMKLNAAGNSLVYSSYLGGLNPGGNEGGTAIAVDASGNAYVTGSTESTSFPVTTARSFTPPYSVFVTKIGAADSARATSGQSVNVSTAPGVPGDAGISATLTNNGGGTPTITAESFPSNPGTADVINVGGRFVDLKVTGAALADSVTARFYYPSTVTGSAEVFLRLLYFNGTSWRPVRSSNNSIPAKSMNDNLDGTVSGGRFTVVFDATSTPKITELTGTVFTSSVAASYSACLLYDPTRANRSGSTIPIKIQLCDPDVGNLSASDVVVTALSVGLISNSAPGLPQDPGNANPDSNFRYDATLGGSGGYIFNLSTKGLSTGTYELRFKAGADTVVHSVQFEVR